MIYYAEQALTLPLFLTLTLFAQPEDTPAGVSVFKREFRWVSQVCVVNVE